MHESHVQRLLCLKDFNPGGSVWNKFGNRHCDLVEVIRQSVHAHCDGLGLSESDFNDLCYTVLIAMQQRVGGS